MEHTDVSTKRRRKKYSKLICLGCRARRIRCELPDGDVQPSPVPQPVDKACKRCRVNGIECIVDATTLGRPTMKRGRSEEGNAMPATFQALGLTESVDYEIAEQDVDDYLLVQPEHAQDQSSVPREAKKRPSRKQLFDAMTSTFNLLAVLLSRDKRFAAQIGAPPVPYRSVLKLIDKSTAVLLDDHLFWHKLHYPEIPSLRTLRHTIDMMDDDESQQCSQRYLLALLCGLALDVPSPKLVSLAHLRPAIQALIYHYGQQLLFTLDCSHETVLSLALTAEYHPLALTSNQASAASALKAVPYIVLGKSIAIELKYHSAGSRLSQALTGHSTGNSTVDVDTIMFECLHWARLSMREDPCGGTFDDWVKPIDETALECLSALRMAAELGKLPKEMILSYCLLSCRTQMLESLRDMTEHWRDLSHIEEVMQTHKAVMEKQRHLLVRLFSQQDDLGELSSVISHLMDMERHLSCTLVIGAALFYAIMNGAFAHSQQGNLQPEQALQVSDNIINQLLAHDGHDPERPPHRRFLEQCGTSRMDDLERCVTNFITAADTLKLQGILYIPPTRQTIESMVLICKDIVENNAARLKGWGGLHERVEVQMILLGECARRLESSSSGGSDGKAFERGCVLSAAAKLIRSFVGILRRFVKCAAGERTRSATGEESDRTHRTVGPGPVERPDEPVAADGAGEWDSLSLDDVLLDWDSWIQFDASEFLDLFPGALDT